MTRLVLFTGKGGVGKSSTSAATAQYWASQGYRTILVSSDPAHSTEDVLGVPVGFKPTLIAENFWAAGALQISPPLPKPKSFSVNYRISCRIRLLN